VSFPSAFSGRFRVSPAFAARGLPGRQFPTFRALPGGPEKQRLGAPASDSARMSGKFCRSGHAAGMRRAGDL